MWKTYTDVQFIMIAPRGLRRCARVCLPKHREVTASFKHNSSTLNSPIGYVYFKHNQINIKSRKIYIVRRFIYAQFVCSASSPLSLHLAKTHLKFFTSFALLGKACLASIIASLVQT